MDDNNFEYRMNNYGFVKVAAASPMVKVADCEYNTEHIYKMIAQAESQQVSVIVFPELCITAYTCGDLFNQKLLVDKAAESLVRLCRQTQKMAIVSIVGLPILVENKLYNAAAIVGRGQIYGIVPKMFLPNYDEFYEKRWFSSASELKQNYIRIAGYNNEILVSDKIIFKMCDFNFGIEICEDLWTVVPPSGFHSLHGADVIFNLSASNEIVGKYVYRKNLIAQQSARCLAGYVYASAGAGESTTDIVFSGAAMIAENGTVLAEGERYSFDSQMIVADIDVEKLRQERIRNKSFSVSEYREIDLSDAYSYIAVDKIWEEDTKKTFSLSRRFSQTPFVPEQKDSLAESCQEIFTIQTCGLAKRMLHIGCKDAVVGISGGLDSTLALLVLINVYDKLKIGRKHIWGITMPGFGTSDRTYNNAIRLMQLLGVTIREIPIGDAVEQHFKDIDHSIDDRDAVYENSQARERTQILMDYANKVNGLVVGTGDLSELALGWCTYNGDHMSMYGVNASVPKTLVKALTRWVADSKFAGEEIQKLLHDIVDTPISPELLPANNKGEIGQITEDAVGPYILHDFFLFYMLRYGFSPSKIFFLAGKAFDGVYSRDVILSWMRVFYKRFFNNQFKRSCLPDGTKVGSVSLSPRGDWRMPSDASYALWLEELEKLANGID